MSEQSIFLAALDISDPAERAAYVEAACGGNAALRTEIEALLAAHERPGAFLDEPAVAQMSDSGAAETRSVAPGGDSGFAPTRSPDTAGGTTEDVLAFLQPPTRAGSLGRLADYEIQEVLGRGGFGTVLRAFDERLHRVVAIKMMAPQLAASGAARARFLREGRSAAAVRDDHVVNVYAVSDDDEPIPYLVMEFIAGQTLQQKIDKVGPLPVTEVLRIGGQIARGLAAAHATGHIHRDIKPANILLENGVERVKITDFGLARAADDASISQSGVVAGTPQYMAPEQARGEAIDHRADLFSLGSVLYAMCTGRPPFRAESTLAVLKRVCEDDPRPVREVTPAVPQWLADVVAKLHAKKPEDRFQTAKEVADLLANYLTELQMQGTVTPQVVAPPAPAPRRARRRKWAAAAALLLASLALAAIWFGPAAVLYFDNQAAVAFASDSDVVGYNLVPGVGIVGEAPLMEPVEGGPHTTLKLGPGAWQMEAKCKPGRVVERWEVTTNGLFTNRTREYGSERLILTVGRGERLTVRPVLRDAPPAPSPKPEDGWVRLFNGKDLTGWKETVKGPTCWKVEGNVLKWAPGLTLLPSILSTERTDFLDFHLRMELRTNSSTRGSIHTRSDGLVKTTGYGVWLMDVEGKAPIFSLTRQGGTAQKAKPVNVKPEEWYQLEIIARGNEFQVKVDNQLVAQWTDDNPLRTSGPITIFQMVPSGMLEFRKIEIKELPPTKSAADPKPVPQKAADVLPSLVGTWKIERQSRDPKSPPDQAPSVGYLTYDFVAGSKFLRGRCSVLAGGDNFLDLLSFDPGNNAVRRWVAWSDGRTYGPVSGQFNPANRTLVMSLRIGDLDSIHQFEFLDANTYFHQFFLKDASGTIIREVRHKGTRVSGPVTLPNLPLDPKRPDEMKVLDRLVGEWRSELTVTDIARPDKPKVQTQRTTAELVVGGRVVEVIDTGEATGASDYALVWFDSVAKQYRQWFFNGTGGFVNEFTGTWDEGSQTLTWHSPDKRLEGRWVFKGDDLREFRHLVKATDGKVLNEATGVSRRVTPAVAPFDAAKAKEHQDAWARHLGTPVEYENTLGMKLRLIPPGEFTMGSSADEIDWLLTRAPDLKNAEWWIKDWVKREGPQHRVTIREPFLMGAHEVTVGQFREFVKATNYKTEAERTGGGKVWNNDRAMLERKPEYVWNNPKLSGSESHPVAFVTLADAQAFCAWLGKQDGRKYTIPAEEQWEYACRAGTTTRWSFGDDPAAMPKYGWTAPHADWHAHPVGQLASNPFGLFDMHGNVDELVVTPRGDEYQRGGESTTSPQRARSAWRAPVDHGDSTLYRGFRIALVGDLKAKPPLSDKERFQGAWVGESGECNGQPLSKEMAARMRLTVEGGALRVTLPGATAEESGTFKLDPDVSPKEFDVIDPHQKGLFGIYRFLDDDRLEICMSEEKERPKEFKSAGGPTRKVIVLRRAPPEKATWQVTYAEYDGKKLTDDEIRNWRVVVDGDRYTHAGFPEPQAGTFKFDWTKKPHPGVFAVDYAVTDGPQKGKTVLGIWEYYGTTMRVCTAKPGSPNRPNLFVTEPGSGGWILVLKEVSPAKEAPNPAAVQALKDAVAAKTRVRDEAKVRFEVGKFSKIDLLIAEADLSEARIKLAEEERKPAEVVAHLEALVRQRQEERDLIAIRVEVGVDRQAVLDDADARLADAKARLAKVKPPGPTPVAPAPHPAAHLLRKFDPAADETITRGQQDKTGWLFKASSREKRTLRLYEIANPQVDAGGVLVFRVKMSTFDVSRAYPEVVCRFPDGTETRSAVPTVAPEGSTGLAVYEARCPPKPGPKPDSVRLNLVFQGVEGGHVFLKEMEVWHLPTGHLHGRLGAPTTLPRKFDPAGDESVTFATHDATGWLFFVKPGQETTIRLFEVENPATDKAATLVLRGRFNTYAAKGAYLQIVCCFPDGTEAVSNVPEVIAEGDTNPTSYEVRHTLKKGQKPYLVRLNLILKKSGKEQSVYLKELELSQAPAEKK